MMGDRCGWKVHGQTVEDNQQKRMSRNEENGYRKKNGGKENKRKSKIDAHGMNDGW